jgi:peptidoglycan-associated lipoprotein
MRRELTTIHLLLATVLTALLLGGCGKTDSGYGNISTSQKPEGQGIVLPKQGSPANDDTGFAEGELEPLDSEADSGWAEDTSSDEFKATYGRSTPPLLPVYFAFDSSSIDIDQFDNLNLSAVYLLENRALPLVVEGNCDERGTADYNIALGEMRAQNVRKYLINYGVEESRIRTISYGSERPLFPESNEQAWAGNRRADLVLR